MKEQAVEEKRDTDALEGEVESPQQSVRQFKNLDALLDFCKMSKPAGFNVRSGYNEDGQYVWELVYPRNQN